MNWTVPAAAAACATRPAAAPHPFAAPRAAPGTPGALVLGGAHGSLGIVRSLGRRGIPVWVLSNDHPIARFSRYAQYSPAWPEKPEQQVAFLLDLAARFGLDRWVLFPGGDNESELLARHADRLSAAFRLTTPPLDVLQWAYHKRLTYRLAEHVGADYPWTCYPRNREELATLRCPFPVVLKPAVKETRNAFTMAKAWRVEDRQQLLARYDEACLLVDPQTIVLQELIPGNGEAQFSYAGLWSKGRPAVWLVARRTRQYPIDFGYTSTFVETVERPEIEEISTRLLHAIAYSGLVEVEFKYDARDRRYKLLDINARTWTWHMLGRRAGIDFPYLMWLAAQGEPLPAVAARAGVRWIHAVRDLVAACQQMRQGSLSPGAWLRSLLGPTEFAVFAADDPLPAVLDVPLMFQRAWKRGRLA